MQLGGGPTFSINRHMAHSSNNNFEKIYRSNSNENNETRRKKEKEKKTKKKRREKRRLKQWDVQE